MAQPGNITPEQLTQVISETLSPNATIRKTAEGRLKAAQVTPGYPLVALNLVASAEVDGACRQAAAVHFKNTIKKGWDVNREDGTEGIVISPNERNTIKTHLVQLMCTVPPQLQVQLSESISLIADVDYPDQWQNLLPEMVQQFNSSDPSVVIGVLKTANSIFKSFRYVERSDELYRIILFTLKGIQAPLLALFKKTGQALDAVPNDPNALKPLFEALRLICRIFYSLNYQDLPEFFEDNMSAWMTDFAKYLQYKNPALTDEDEENEASPIDKLQAAIIRNLALYADKDEECFMEYLPQFTSLVWNLLIALSSYPKHDDLATTSIRFLSSLVQKQMHKGLFQDEAALKQIVSQIVIPNLMFRESDEERFEDDPREFITTEVEGSDSETRRKCSQDLLRAMCRHFEAETTKICQEHVALMLQEFSSDPNGKWRAKDAAIHLMMGIAIRKEGTQGVSELNESVNVMDFFQTQVLPELQDGNHSNRPVVKATCIKFVSTFRNQFFSEHLVQLLPLLINHLGSPIVVVHTFAAYSIERFLFTKVDVSGNRQAKIGSAELKPFLEPLFGGLFTIIDNVQLNENDYVMKCVMRSLATVGEDILPVTQIVITKLTDALGRIAKNPRNPQFNHYLFESIAVLVRSVCSKESAATATFEPLLFAPFNIVLQMEIAELTPYVFQVLAQLLEYRPAEAGLGAGYTSLFPPILTPALWEQKGNIPALTRLLKAYIRKAPREIIPQIDAILGVFQKLLSVRSTEACGFDILTSVTVFFPPEALESKFPTIFQLLLVRLQGSTRVPRYKRLVTDYFALYAGKFGSQNFIARLNLLQPGMALMLLEQVWLPRLSSEPPVIRMEAKVQVVGLTKLLCETPAMLADEKGQKLWSWTVSCVVKILTSASFKNSTETSAIGDEDEVEIGYDAQFSRLRFASKAAEDLFPEVPADPSAVFVQSLYRLSTSNPGRLLPMIHVGLSEDPKLAAGLEIMFQQVGLQLA